MVVHYRGGMTAELLGRWRLVARVAPVVAAVVVAKVVFHELGWDTIALNPLYTGLVAANVFLLGFLLAGTLTDYKESEKLPGDLAASIESIADESLILYQDKQSDAALDCVSHTRELARALTGWLRGTDSTHRLLEKIAGLNDFFLQFEPLTQPNFIVRLKQEQSAIRRTVLRIQTIRDTSFVGAGYAIAELATLLLVVGLLLVDVGSFFDAVFLLGIITFLLVYMILLIRDLDNPFDYDGSKRGAAEVSLRPFEELQERLASRIEGARSSQTPTSAVRTAAE
jgi:branched-subunit amino acid transport protein AzlD